LKKRNSLLILLALSTASCGNEDSAESNRFETLQAIDDGDFDVAISNLSNCEKAKGFTEEECLVNRGMSYFGKAGYDLIAMGEDLYLDLIDKTITDDERDIKILGTILDRFNGENIQNGIYDYKSLLSLYDMNETSCTKNLFETFTNNQQQSCLAINPILLLEILDEDSKTSNEKSVDLEDLIFINNSVTGIVPSIDSENMAKILNGDEVSDEVQDQLWASTCMIIPDLCSDFNFDEPELVKSEGNLDFWKIESENGTIYRVTDENGNFVLVDYDENGSAIPRLSGEIPKTLDSEIVSKLNNDEEFLTSIAISVDIGEGSSEEKVADFKTEICGYSTCEITERNLIEYLNNF
jgi:hypothetical protein